MYKSKYKKASSRIARRNEARRIFGLVLKIGLPVIFLISLIFVLRADFLQVKNFEVMGVETISPESLKSQSSSFISGYKLFFLPNSNIIFLNKVKLASLLISKFSRIEKIEINKQYFSRTVDLKITERKADYLWCSQSNECFFMTEGGLIFEKTEVVDGSLIFRGIIVGDPLMKNFATPAKMQNYLKLIENLKEARLEVVSVSIESNDRAVAKTDIGDIIFAPEEADLSHIAQNVVLLINEVRSKNPTAKFNYIDARFDNKMFYKLY